MTVKNPYTYAAARKHRAATREGMRRALERLEEQQRLIDARSTKQREINAKI